MVDAGEGCQDGIQHLRWLSITQLREIVEIREALVRRLHKALFQSCLKRFIWVVHGWIFEQIQQAADCCFVELLHGEVELRLGRGDLRNSELGLDLE